jgi:2-oxoglutarate dehydrogenase E1 component
MLSEEAVLGFEYGYTLAEPNALVLWEAQFGDFANGAQVLFDQFISSGERKWLRMSGLVLLLAARLRRPGARALLCTARAVPAAVRGRQYAGGQLHHTRQLLSTSCGGSCNRRVPKAADPDDAEVAAAAQEGHIDACRGCRTRERVPPAFVGRCGVPKGGIPEIKLVTDSKIQRVVLCTGKVYYDLYEEREARGVNDVYLLRVEQLYPFPAKALITELSRFKNAEMVWCQEEPKNMGAWAFIDPYLEWVLAHINAKHARVRYTGRPAAASTATGVMGTHKAQLEAFLEDALGD